MGRHRPIPGRWAAAGLGLALAGAAGPVPCAGAADAPPVPLAAPASPSAAPAETVYEMAISALPYDPAATSVRQLSRAQLDRQAARSVAEVLERNPAIYATTGGRNERILAIRGFDQRQTAVLIDGAPGYIAYDGQFDLAMLPAELIETVSVGRGPGLLGGGPSGLGPTLSLQTRQPGRGPLWSGHLQGGWHGEVRGSVVHAKQLARWAYTLYWGAERASGFPLSAGFQPTPLQGAGPRLNSDRSGWYGGASARTTWAGPHTWAATLTWLDAAKGVPPSTADSVPRFWRFNRWQALTASLNHAYRGGFDLDELVYARGFANLLDAYDDATYSSQSTPRAMHSWHDDRTVGAQVRARLPLPALARRPLQARLLGHGSFDRHADDPASPAFARVLWTAAGELTCELSAALTATVGSQVSLEQPIELRGEQSQAPVGIGPLAALRWQATQRLAIGATWARRQRFASLKERFSRGLGTRLANAQLRPEQADHWNLELSWRANRWLKVNGSAFRADLVDLIDRVYLGDGLDQLQNIARARLMGGEVELQLKLQPWLRAEVGYAYVQAERLSPVPAPLLQRPTHKASLSAALAPLPWLELSSFVRMIGPQSFQHPLTRQLGALGGYTVTDVRIDVSTAARWSLYAEASNVLDSNYQTEYGFPDPGRRIWIGIRSQFGRANPGPKEQEWQTR